MLQSLFRALNVILPICLMLICGILLKQTGYIRAEMISEINKLIFRLFLPASVFKICYSADFDASNDFKLVFFCCLITLTFFLAYIPVIRRIEKENARRSVMLQAAFRGNLAVFGTPVLMLLYDETELGAMAVLLAFLIPELNILSVLCFEVFSGRKADWKKVCLRILTNPLICAIGLGIFCNRIQLRLPTFVTVAVDSISGVATPLAFVLLGASFSMASAKANRIALTLILIGKLLILPVSAIIMCTALGFKGPALASVIALFGSPTAVVSIPMAEEMGGDSALAGEAVLLSTLVGIFTIFAWIFSLSFFALL